jgi:hypothetical protein
MEEMRQGLKSRVSYDFNTGAILKFLYYQKVDMVFSKRIWGGKRNTLHT